MFKLTTTTIGLLGYIVNGYDYVCAPGACTVDANSSTVVIANTSVTSLTVNCLAANACKKQNTNPGLKVYSSAETTYINCDGEDSCEECNFYFGVAPNGEDGFDGTRSKVTVSCAGKQSCKTVNIENTGTITNGLTIDTPADPATGSLVNTGAFMGGLAQCGTSTACVLECGSNMDTCKDSKCYGNCDCQGDACPTNYNQPPTLQPTSNPTPKPTTPAPVALPPGNPIVPAPPANVLPTPEPTASPPDVPAPRNETSCTANGCVLTPGNNYDVTCGAQFTTCTVDCSLEGQCAEGVIINADSANVEIICGDQVSCDKVEVVVTQESVVTIQILEEKAAESMKIVATNPAATVNIIVTGYEGFSMGTLICDANCNLNCLESEGGCKSVRYDCLETSNKCQLTCDEQCPTISNFGDSSCNSANTDASGTCTVTGSGNGRIVALNNIAKLVVNCAGSDAQCKASNGGLTIYSGANDTVLECNSQDGCEDVQAFVGVLTGARVPYGFNADQFGGNYGRDFTAACGEDSSCKGLKLYAEGSVTATLDGAGEDSLQDTQSICAGCDGLNYRCREFGGCLGAIITCTNPLNCDCQDTYVVEIENTTEAYANTELPRASCPAINQYTMRKAAGINTMNAMVHNTNGTMKVVVPIIIVSLILIIGFGLIMINYNRKYKKVGGVSSKTDKFMLKNENIYATYQVEMH